MSDRRVCFYKLNNCFVLKGAKLFVVRNRSFSRLGNKNGGGTGAGICSKRQVKYKVEMGTKEGMKSLFVGNLPWSVTSEELQAKFGEQCEVSSARVVNDRLTNRSRGFGFVDVPEDKVTEVIASMNGYKWGGRDISVNEAKPRVQTSR